jgi:hypothetical protein
MILYVILQNRGIIALGRIFQLNIIAVLDPVPVAVVRYRYLG